MDKELNPDEPAPEAPKPAEETPVDLSALQGFDFGTSWSESKKPRGTGRSDNRDFKRGDRRSQGGPADRKDRRPFKPGNFRKSDERAPREGQGNQGRRFGDQGRKPYGRPEIPKKVAEVSFYPEDNGFKALCKALRVSAITYELFEIARTILDKEERFYLVIRTPDEKSTGAEEPEASFYVVESDGLPFLSQDAAMQHALADCLDHYFTSETQEVEPPSGTFTAIQKCGVTGELLGPPNYHRLKKIMADHHASQLPNMPYAKFESRIESVKEEEVIAQWLEKMKIQTTYKLKPEFGEDRQFEDGETARAFVKANLAGKLVKEVNSTRVEGTQLSKIKDPSLKTYLEYAWDRQKRFPLDSANLLRGRLRRQKFALYKKGTKGVSYVCAVKRRFREPGESLSEPVSKLIDFIEKHPKIAAKELPQQYLGFTTFAPEGETQPEITDEQKAAFKAFTLDFQWLLKEGYIAEYSDGTVFAHPAAVPSQPAKSKAPKVPSSKAANTEVVAPVSGITKEETVQEEPAPVGEAVEAVVNEPSSVQPDAENLDKETEEVVSSPEVSSISAPDPVVEATEEAVASPDPEAESHLEAISPALEVPEDSVDETVVTVDSEPIVVADSDSKEEVAVSSEDTEAVLVEETNESSVEDQEPDAAKEIEEPSVDDSQSAEGDDKEKS